MKLTDNRILRSVLLAVVTVSLAGAAPSPLANGVYAVLREGPKRGDPTDLFYNQKYSESDKNNPPKYVALDTSFFVPLVLAEPPAARKDDHGWTLLQVTLSGQHVKTLEKFTRMHLGGSAAIVIGGEIVTMHKIRSVIRDGKVQITRCQDNACETLRLKLMR